jgi:hypothetical protein
MAGYNRGTLLHWDGSFWNEASRTPRHELFGIWAVNPDDVWAVGMDGARLRYQPLSARRTGINE